MKRFMTALAACALMISIVVPAVGAAESTDLTVPDGAVRDIGAADVETLYIVQMVDDPAVAYDGGISGLAATRPAAGEKIDVDAANVRAYRDYLRGQHDQAMRDVGADVADKAYSYSVAFNGFSARMTGAEAAALAARADVLSIWQDEIRQPDTISTPDFLGLNDPGSAWDQGYLGEDIVVGIVDTGIWPENPSFQVPRSDRRAFQGPDQFHGECVPGEEFELSDCNAKLVGARWFGEGFGGEAGIAADFPFEYWSARDWNGHGSHTAATAAGSRGVDVVVDGQPLGTASGMAPLAKIAAYKVCWADAGCSGVDLVAAIDQAVADGVDVINYSISGTRTNFLDPVEVAFLFAADAGVFVAASAGNTPGAGTVAHPSPWITTVAAGTHDRYSEATLTLGDGSTYTSASFQSTGTDELPLVYSSDVGLAGADAEDVRLCVPGSLDPALVAGTMVLCDRGTIARIEKSLAVQEAGGLGMILGNTSPNSINADLHFVPSIHVDEFARDDILAYIGSASSPTGQLGPGVAVTDETAPQRAAFSSQGPLQASSDLLKPDIMAPGVDVIAAVAPPGNYGRDWDAYSGTSMSSPHIAGLAAVVMSANRRWTPAMVKSALMTTANSVDGHTPFDVGSGHVDPNSAIDPGLVYDAGFNQYVDFIFESIDRSDLNQPNITIGELAYSQTVTRRVTNVGGSTATYTVSVDAPDGIDVTVSPSTITVPRGRTATYQVTLTQVDAPLGEYSFGSLTWSHGPHDVTSQIVVRPVQLAAPDAVSGSGTDGSVEYDVTFGYEGDFTAAPHGLVPATTQDGNVVDDPDNDINSALASGVGVTFHTVTVPDGTAYSRISLFDDYTDGDDDLDLYVFTSAGSFVGGSGSGTSAEQVDLLFPAADDYIVVVHGWQTDGDDSNYTLFDWSVSATPADGTGATDLTVSGPSTATLGSTEPISVSWSGLDTGVKYLGAVSYTDTDIFGLTLVNVTTE